MQESRLFELTKMEDGWLDGGGKKPTGAALLVAGLVDDQDGGVHFFPTPEGGITVERTADDGYPQVIEISCKGRIRLWA